MVMFSRTSIPFGNFDPARIRGDTIEGFYREILKRFFTITTVTNIFSLAGFAPFIVTLTRSFSPFVIDRDDCVG